MRLPKAAYSLVAAAAVMASSSSSAGAAAFSTLQQQQQQQHDHLLDPSHIFPYEPPAWAKPYLGHPPQHGRLKLAHLPTPLYRLHFQDVVAPLSAPEETTVGDDDDDASTTTTMSIIHPAQIVKDLNVSLFIKRDDCAGGVELGGNKIRKLEFLLADALQRECDALKQIIRADSDEGCFLTPG